MAMMGTGTARGKERAREAAEAAIASPLLEDVNISGARGILVNVTAGRDLSIGEFDDVGNAIKSLASDDATVVVGTVIDPEMAEDLRVTLVATGLGGERPSNTVRSASVAHVHGPRVSVETQYQERPSVRLVEPEEEALTEIRHVEQGASVRQAGVARAAARSEAGRGDYDMDYLDIPAFLRKQAD